MIETCGSREDAPSRMMICTRTGFLSSPARQRWREGTPVLTIVDYDDDSNETGQAVGAGRSLLDEIVRDGARQMLAAALQAEVADYIARHAGEIDDNGHRLVVRNGYHAEREVVTAAGAVAVKAPRVNRSEEHTSELQSLMRISY